MSPNDVRALLEQEYRRGYRDGWIEAGNFLLDAHFIRSRNTIYDLMLDHYNFTLTDWVKGDCTKEIWPPALTVDCVYCGAPAEQMDHIIPKSRGGSDAFSNLVPACRHCNLSKNNRTPEEWRPGTTIPKNWLRGIIKL